MREGTARTEAIPPRHRQSEATYRLLSDRSPATTLGLRRQRRSSGRVVLVTLLLSAIQWTLFAFGIPACYTIPLFIVSWIVPAVVVIQTVTDMHTGFWSE